MISEIFAVFDTAADTFLEPFPGPTLAFAIRGFQEACQTQDHQFQKFPEDYALYHIGTFNASLGEITPVKAHKIAMANNFIRNES